MVNYRDMKLVAWLSFITFLLVSVVIITPRLVQAEITTIFSDDFESGINGWTVDGSAEASTSAYLWHKSQRNSQSPTHSMYYGKEDTGNYDTGNRNFGTLTSPSIILPDLDNLTVNYQQILVTENSASSSASAVYDLAKVEISNDDGLSWNQLTQFNFSQPNWTGVYIDLSLYRNSSVKLRFSFDTVDSLFNNFEGWYIDDIQITANALAPTPTPTIIPTPSPSPTPLPTPTPEPINNPPLANAGLDKSGFTNQIITFDGSTSSDQEGPLSFAWSFGDGTTATDIQPSHAYSQPGSYIVNLTVTDSGGLTATDTATVTISNDNVSITKAIFYTSKKQLVIEANSNSNGQAILSVNGFGNMTYDSNLKLYRFVKSPISYPSSIFIQSSFGGSASSKVTKLSK